ncbi:nucleotidyltransferase family protein isoform X2 [Tasmannia lanceolata]
MDRPQFRSAYGAFGVLELSLTNILSLIKPLEEDQVKRLNTINEFTTIVGTVESLRGASVEPFGSFVSNLYTRSGDLDISIELPNSIISSIARKQKKNLLRDVLRALGRADIAHNIQFIPNARVPLLIFQSNYSNISCDISIDNLVGQIKSKFLLWIADMDERFRDMVLLIKEWAKTKNINDPKSGTLNSYSLSLLVIFHFQTCKPPIFPPLKDIYEGNIIDDLTGMRSIAGRRIEDTCTASIARFRSQGFNQANRSSLSELFVSFFEKFSGIDIMSVDFAICTYTGRWERKWNNAKWMQKPHHILIEDPFEQPDNAARAVALTQLTRISRAFGETHQMLSSPSVLSDRNSLTVALVRPHISSELGSRNPQGYSNAHGRVFRHRSQVSTPVNMAIEDRFVHALRIGSRPSSSVTLQSPGPGQQMWRPRSSDR